MTDENCPFFDSNCFRWLLKIIYGGYFHRCRREFENRRKLFDPIFSSYAQASEIIIDLVSAVFS
jgi:hypothetical protein